LIDVVLGINQKLNIQNYPFENRFYPSSLKNQRKSNISQLLLFLCQYHLFVKKIKRTHRDPVYFEDDFRSNKLSLQSKKDIYSYENFGMTLILSLKRLC
jgi:hypothetical protein